MSRTENWESYIFQLEEESDKRSKNVIPIFGVKCRSIMKSGILWIGKLTSSYILNLPKINSINDANWVQYKMNSGLTFWRFKEKLAHVQIHCQLKLVKMGNSCHELYICFFSSKKICWHGLYCFNLFMGSKLILTEEWMTKKTKCTFACSNEISQFF
jgi:hypothetical protein